MENLYDYTNYREYLKKTFPSRGEKRGQRRQLAKVLGCQTSFISLVVTERAHLNEDMAFKCAQFLRFNSRETEFFLLLYHHERASSSGLRSYYQTKIKDVVAKLSLIDARVGATETIPVEVQAQYYSNWTYAAIHTAIMNPETNEVHSIANKLKISEELTKENLEFLEKWRFVQRIGNQFAPGVTRVHLSADSAFIIQHHRNWHLEAMRAVGEKNPLDLNYSGALSMSKADANKIRALLLNAVEAIEKQIRPSKDEETVGMSLNYFRY